MDNPLSYPGARLWRARSDNLNGESGLRSKTLHKVGVDMMRDGGRSKDRDRGLPELLQRLPWIPRFFQKDVTVNQSINRRVAPRTRVARPAWANS